MQENSGPQRPRGPRKKHELWVALKAAYERYAASSDLAQGIAADGSKTRRESEIITAIEDQHRAFHEYIEARFQFLECHVDEAQVPAAMPTLIVRQFARRCKDRLGQSLIGIVRKLGPCVGVAAV